MRMKSKMLLIALCALTGVQNINAQLGKTRNSTYANVYTYQTGERDRSVGTFFAAYDYTTMAIDVKGVDDITYHGVSVGFNYFFPFADGLGLTAGIKGQYFFRNDTEGIYTYKDNLFAGTIPVDLSYDLRLSDSFALTPYAGLYGRYNFMAHAVTETKGKSGHESVSQFDDTLVTDPFERFQYGWEAGITARISDMVTFGAGFWHDLNEICDHTKMYGINFTVGANF